MTAPALTPETIDDTGLTRLAQAVMINAARDAADGDMQARAWLLMDAEPWAVVAGVSFDHVQKFARNPRMPMRAPRVR